MICPRCEWKLVRAEDDSAECTNSECTWPYARQMITDGVLILEYINWLEAQISAINSVKPGQTFENMQKNCIEIITRGLKKLGILKGSEAKLIKEESYKEFYMHGIGHWLGIDVHDVGSYVNEKGRSKPFAPGMVITVEPGIYISKKSKSIDKKWKGIGIRIEDDVLITSSGCEVLSGKLPKEIDAIEAIMSSH